MPWLADTDVSAAYGVGQAMVDAPTEAESRRRALAGLARLVPADVMTVDLVELATGAVCHNAVPVEAEPAGAFEVVVRCAADHPLLAAHAARRRRALRLSDLVEPGALTRSDLNGKLLHGSRVEYQIAIGVRTGRDEATVVGLGRTSREFSERDRDVLDVAQPGVEGALRAARARERLARALADDPPPGVAVVLLNGAGEIELASVDGERWLTEHFGAGEHPGWLPEPIAEWLALPPRPPLVSERDGRRLTVRLLPGDPHALLLEEDVASFRSEALRRLSLTTREADVLRAAAVIQDEADIALELFLSVHAVRERLARLEAKLGVRTVTDAVARALRESS
jgi:DNA-binding CsgD family transcriptional regulator